jgi:hypothetical protein
MVRGELRKILYIYIYIYIYLGRISLDIRNAQRETWTNCMRGSFIICTLTKYYNSDETRDIGRENYVKLMGDMNDEREIFACKPTVATIIGSLSPRHGTSSVCGWRNGHQCGR